MAVAGLGLTAVPASYSGAAAAGAATAARQDGAQPCRLPARHVRHRAAPPHVPGGAHAYFGGFSLNDSDHGSEQAGFSRLSRKACRPLDVTHVYLQWKKPFPSQWAAAAARQGHQILVSWTGTDTRTMASGSVDSRIARLARQIKAFRDPVFFEYRWEMDRPNLAHSVHRPADFIAAWKRVHAIFARQKVADVAWVWCPTDIGFARGYAQAYYPGDSQVDWVCTDVYPDYRFGPQDSYQPVGMLVHAFLKWWEAHPKPAMIGEMGVPRSYSPSMRAKWLLHARHYFKRHHMIKAVLYFDHNARGQPSSGQHALGSNPTVLAAFRALASDGYFRPRTRADPHGG